MSVSQKTIKGLVTGLCVVAIAAISVAVWLFYFQPASDKDYRDLAQKVDQLSEVYVTLRSSSIGSVNSKQQAAEYQKQLKTADDDTRSLLRQIADSKPVIQDSTLADAFTTTKEAYEQFENDAVLRKEAADKLVIGVGMIRSIGAEKQAVTADEVATFFTSVSELKEKKNIEFRDFITERAPKLAELEKKIAKDRESGALNDADLTEYSALLSALKIAVSDWLAQIEYESTNASKYTDALAAFRAQVSSRVNKDAS